MNPIQLYSMATPNGQKIGLALEEMGLPYEPHVINIMKGDQFKPEFVKINPNSKIPAIVDPDGPGGQHSIFESGAILLYLAEKSGKFLSSDPALRSRTIQWLFFQVGGIGPMFGQFGHFFKFAKDKCDHPYPLERYTTETKRLLGVLDRALEGKKYLVGNQYSIADMAIYPWVICLDRFYGGSDILDLKSFSSVQTWVAEIDSRPLTKKGLAVCSITH
jgi:GST-like protein